MAQYHFSATMVSRKKGQSAVAAAAYRAGERIKDEHRGKWFDYRTHPGILYKEILAPGNALAWMLDRAQLWNAVEKIEKRKDSQVARSIDIGLMSELPLDKNLELIRGFIQEQFVKKGMIADLSVHAPGPDSDERNIHAHILLTTRVVTDSGFGKKNRDWDDREELREWREAWARHANTALQQAGLDARIDHRTLGEQGIDREATTHVGPSGKAMEKSGRTSDRAKKNRELKEANDDIAELQKQVAESEKRLAELKHQQEAEQRYAEHSDGPVPGPKKDMPDGLTPEQKHAIEQEVSRQEQARKNEEERQAAVRKLEEERVAAEKRAEEDRQKKLADDQAEQRRRIDEENKNVDRISKDNAERLASQADAIRLAYAQSQQRAMADAYNAQNQRVADEQKKREDAERQQRLADQAKEGPIQDAGSRYAQALGRHYDIRDPYATLAKAAMAEYAAFRQQRDAYDKQIAQTADPVQRQALELRKRVEGAEYLAITGDRIAAQSEIIVGKRNSAEAIYERDKAQQYRIQAQDLRQQLRELRLGPTQEQDRAATREGRPGGQGTDKDAERIRQEDEKQKAREREKKEKDKQREKEEEKERQRDRDRGRGWER